MNRRWNFMVLLWRSVSSGRRPPFRLDSDGVEGAGEQPPLFTVSEMLMLLPFTDLCPKHVGKVLSSKL